MFRQLSVYLMRIIKTPIFWGCVLISAALHLTSICYADELGKEYTIFEILLQKSEMWQQISEELTCSTILQTALGTYGLMFMPVVVMFPFLNYYWVERTTGYARFIQCRISKRRYSIVRAVAGIASSGLVAVLGCLVFGCIVFFVFPQGEGNLENSVVNIWLPKMATYFLYGAIIGTPVLAMAAVFRNRYTVACVPLLALYLLDLTCKKYGMAEWETSYLTYLYCTSEKPVQIVVYAGAALCLAIIFCVVLEKRRDSCA